MEATYEIYLSGVPEEAHEFMDMLWAEINERLNEKNVNPEYVRVEITKRYIYDKN